MKTNHSEVSGDQKRLYAETEFASRHLADGIIMDGDDEIDAVRAAQRQAALDWMRFSDRQDGILASLKLLPLDCLLFVKGRFRLIGCHSQKEIVDRHRKDPKAKANVSKYVKKYMRQLAIPPMGGQRENVNGMRDARMGQLKNGNHDQ